jgi:hypothetical protein
VNSGRLYYLFLAALVMWMALSCKKTEEPLQPRHYDLPDDEWEDDFPEATDTGEI